MITLPKTWNELTYHVFLESLENIQDKNHALFSSSLIFTKYPILGIKNPYLKSIAKEINKTKKEDFLKVVDNRYYETVLLKGLIITSIEDVKTFTKYYEEYMYTLDNWALTDTTIHSNIKVIKKNKEYFFKKAKEYIKDDHEYVVRIGILLFMKYYLTDETIDEVLTLINQIKKEEYYINMAIAWCICDAFIKQRKKTIIFLQDNQLNKFTQNKAISKIRDSYRVSKEDKEEILMYKK